MPVLELLLHQPLCLYTFPYRYDHRALSQSCSQLPHPHNIDYKREVAGIMRHAPGSRVSLAVLLCVPATAHAELCAHDSSAGYRCLPTDKCCAHVHWSGFIGYRSKDAEYASGISGCVIGCPPESHPSGDGSRNRCAFPQTSQNSWRTYAEHEEKACKVPGSWPTGVYEEGKAREMQGTWQA